MPQETDKFRSNGLQSVVAYTKKIMAKYPLVGTADLVQFMAKMAIVTCPLVGLIVSVHHTQMADEEREFG